MTTDMMRPLWARVRSVRAILVAMYALAVPGWLAMSAPRAHAQPLDENCLVNVLNQSAPVMPDGTWALPNVPQQPGLFRVRATCVWGGQVANGMSGLFRLDDNAAITNITIGFEDYIPPPIAVRMVSIDDVLTVEGQTTQLIVSAVSPDGTARDVSSESDGTLFTSSNSAVATVDKNGKITAVKRGSAVITARYEGRLTASEIFVLIPEDDDLDLISNQFEALTGLNPQDPSDAALDNDADQLTNVEEFQQGTQPFIADTDGDGLSDGEEVISTLTSPLLPDTDADTLLDGKEVFLGTNPLAPDTDGDGVSDGVEVAFGLDPLVPNPTTAISGQVRDQNGTPVAGATVLVYKELFTTTAPDGTFLFPAIPEYAGTQVIAEAQLVQNGDVNKGSSGVLTPVWGGATSAGQILLGPVIGAVGGTVTNPNGQPAAGASVTVISGAEVHAAIAGPTGQYIVEQLDAGPVTVQSTNPATGLRAQVFGTLLPNDSTVIDVKLTPSGTVRGKVFQTDGQTLTQAGVQLTLSGPKSSQATTDVFGEYRFGYLPLGSYSVDAQDTAGNRARTVANLNSTNQVFSANLAYLGRGTVMGVVETATGQKVQGAQVKLSSQSVFGGSASVVSGPGGTFSFDGVFVGAFSVSATAPDTGLGGFASSAIQFQGEVVDLTLVLTPAGTLVGTVYESDGTTPVAGVTVKLSPSGKTDTTDASGQYSIPGVPLGGYTVDATNPANGDRGRTTTTVEIPDTETEANVTLNGIGNVQVTVVDGGGVAVPGAQITVTSQTIWGGQKTATADGDGKATIQNVLAGPFSASANDPQKLLAGSAGSTLLPGETAPITVKLENAGVITGVVFAPNGATPASNIKVKLSPSGRVFTTGTDGVYVFDLVAISKSPYTLEAFDSTGTRRAIQSGLTLATHGQVLQKNLTLDGQGTVFGTVLNPDGSPAAGAQITLQSSAVGAPNQYATSTALGSYSFTPVPKGAFKVIAQVPALLYGGNGAGEILFQAQELKVDIQLFANQLPPPPTPPQPGDPGFSPAFGSPLLTLFDANNFAYSIRQSGAVADGSQSVFSGDNGANRGADQLYVKVDGQEALFFGNSANVLSGGREVRITGEGPGSIEVVRRVLVAQTGYFARYLDQLTNPTGQPMTVAVRLESDYRSRTQAQGGFTYSFGEDVVTTASGDNFFGGPMADHWVVLDDNVDSDPFLSANLPALTHVFSGPGASLSPTNQLFAVSFSGEQRNHIESGYQEVTLLPGETISFLHFTAMQLNQVAAIAAAERLAQLPPEALEGLTAADRMSIANFAVPTDGTSGLPALPGLDGTIAGFVLEADETTAVAGAPVRFRSNHVLFGRTYTFTSGPSGEYQVKSTFNNYGSTIAVPLAPSFNVDATHPKSNQLSGILVGMFPDSETKTVTADIIFSGTGWITGTVHRPDGTVVSNGNVKLTHPDVPNALTAAIQPDGAFAFYGIPPGTATLIATLPIPDGTDLLGVASATVTAGQQTIANITIEPAGAVTGIVTNGGGSPAVNVRVDLIGADNFVRTKYSDTGGGFTFIDVPQGDFTVKAYEPFTNVASTKNVSVDPDGVTQANIQLIGLGTVIVSATFGNGAIAKDIQVQMLREPMGNYYASVGKTNFNGILTVQNVPVGNFSARMYNPQNYQLVGMGNGVVAQHGQIVQIALVIPIDQPPTVALTTPAPGISVLQNTAIIASATAADDLQINRVDFAIDGVVKASDYFAPYSVSLTIPKPATGLTTTITAIAVDSGNNATTSAPVVINVTLDTQAPTLTLNTPAVGATIIEGTALTSSATATDNVGVANVKFSAVGVGEVIDTTSPYTASLTVPPTFADAGNTPLSLVVVATDVAGNTTTVTRGVTVVPDQPPAITFLSGPTTGATLIENTSVTFSVSITDDVSAVGELLVDGVLIQTRPTAPYTFTLPLPDADSLSGPLSVVLRARDTQNQLAALAPIAIHVIDDQPPTIAWVAPAPGVEAVEGSTVLLSATATDDIGVAQVEFRADGMPVATRFVQPYTFNLQVPPGPGGQAVVLEAIATDTLGQTTAATRQIVRMDDVVPPTSVAITAPANGAVISVGQSDVMLVIDTSGSTQDSSGADIDGDGITDNILKAEIFSAKEVLNFFDPDRTRVGVVNFASGAVLARSLTNDFALVEATLNNMLAAGPGGGTNFTAAMQVATNELVGPNAVADATPVQLFLSDGAASYPTFEVNRAIQGGIIVNTFAVGSGADTSALAQMANQTGGVMTQVLTPAELVEILPTIVLFGVDGIVARAEASDDVAIHDVSFHLTATDGSIDLTEVDSTEPYIRLLELPLLDEAKEATIVATASDFGGSSIESAPVTVTILPANNKPEIVALLPTIASPGDIIQINGKFFAPGAANNTVTMSGVPATVVSASKIQVTATVPAGAMTGPVIVTSGGVASNAMMLSIDTDGDGLTDEEEAALGTLPNDPDSDDDGLSDGDEVNDYDTNPLAADSDGDTMPDGYEVNFGFNPKNPSDGAQDPDADGLTNAEEAGIGTHPYDPDSDNDGLLDGAEVDTHDTDPLDADTDNGGASDGFEVEYGLNPKNPADDQGDADNDGLTADQEETYGTDPTNPDSDGDTLLDGAEVTAGTNPADADTDNDGLDDNEETITSPTDPDSDNDGLLDGAEVEIHNTNPLVADTDGDTLSDGQEVNVFGSNPLSTDSDGDGLLDGVEVNTYGTDPANDDTDGDNLLDGNEVNLYGSDPTVPDICKIPQCDENGCVLVDDPDPLCCETDLFLASFDSGTSEGFTFENSNTSSMWQVFTGGQSTSAPGALYYGNIATLNFANGTTNGRAISPQIGIPNRDGNTLRFKVWMDTESSTSYDRLFVEVEDNGLVTTVWDKSQYNAGGGYLQWRLQEVNLDAYKNKSIRLRWYFNSIDSIANGGQGVYVDDVTVTTSCPPKPCATVEECDDEDLCTIDTCLGEGGCNHAPVECDDANECTDESCDPGVGCEYFPSENFYCDDGDFCTYDDYCDAGVCQPGFVEDCNDGYECTVEACDSEQGCVYTYVSGIPCFDGNQCTIDDMCQSEGGCWGTYQDGMVCDDGDNCSYDDICQIEGGCYGTYLECDDGDNCTYEYCDGYYGQCLYFAECNDGNPCTLDLCDPETLSCTYDQIPEGGACDDDDACTTDGICDEFGNCNMAYISCDDGNSCTDDWCDYYVGCQHVSQCDDSNPCTLDACEPIAGCSFTPVNTPECCQTEVYVESFDDGAADGFSYFSSSETVGWGVLADARFITANHAMYYGNPNTMTYDDGDTNSGTFDTPIISVPDIDGVVLRFFVWMNTETGNSYDRLFVYVDGDGLEGSIIWDKSEYDNVAEPGQWRSFEVDLTIARGKNVTFRWYFDTIDNIANDMEGVYIDQISISHPCLIGE